MSSHGRTRRVIAIAPTSPPCFGSRQVWLEWLVAAAREQRAAHVAGPLLLKPGQPATFDYGLNICADCTPCHEHAMKRVGRCKPSHLTDIATAAAEAAST